jgi:rRNA processing protein Gar1
MAIDAPFTGATSNAIHYRFDPVFDIAKVLSSNTTAIIIDKSPIMNSNNTVIVSAQKVVGGVVDVYDRNNNYIQVDRSNATNSSFKFVSSNSSYLGTIIGATTQSQARVDSVDDVSANILRPLLNTLIVSGTSASLTGTLTKKTGGTDTRAYMIDKSNRIDINDTAIVKSKSNEIVGTLLAKSLKLNVNLSTSATDTSPVIDINPSSVVLTHNVVNDDITGETGRYGNAVAKYVSKRLVLAEGMDAEDMKLYMTAFKPVGTDIYVYAKVLNTTDGDAFNDKDWTLLQQVTSSSVYSDSLDETDYREYEYTFPKAPPATQLAGLVTTYANTTVNGVDTTFTTTLKVGDLVKIVKSNSETDYDILPVTSIGSNTQLTVSESVSFTGTGNTIEKVTQKNAAFKYTRNSYIVRYFDSNNAAYDTYKYMAIKVVLASPNDHNVPYINDIRAVACSV